MVLMIKIGWGSILTKLEVDIPIGIMITVVY